MKTLKKTLVAAAFVAGSLAMGSASAITLHEVPGVNASSVNVQVKDGVATIFGSVESGSEKALIKSYVAKQDDVEKVIDLISFN